MTKNIPSVLFVCIHNAGRSQMAAALTKGTAKGKIEVFSAGSEPADELNPAVIEIMKEEGIDLTQEKPKILTMDSVKAADVVITMGCGDACPIFPGKKYLDWKLEDPAGKSMDEVRKIKEEISRLVDELVKELLI